MNDLDNDLRDALSARAAAVTHDPGAYAAVVARRARRRRGWSAFATAGLAATAVAAGGVVATRPPEPAAQPTPAAPAPAHVAGVYDDVISFSEPDNLRDHVGMRPAGHRATAVAAAGDGRLFYMASVADEACASTLNRVTVEPGHTVNAPVRRGAILGEITAMALSPDGARLAYTLRRRIGRSTTCAAAADLHVRHLATGAERVWRAGSPPTPADAPLRPASLSWSPDGRFVSLGARHTAVDTAAAGTTLRAEETAVARFGRRQCLLHDRSYRGRTGQLAGVAICPGLHPGVYVLDGDVATRLLFRTPSEGHFVIGEVAFDRSGDHAFLLIRHGGERAVLYRWDSDTGLRPVDTRGRDLAGIDW